MTTLTLAQASIIVDEALKKGRETGCAPLTVAVLDGGGHLVALKREDRSGILRPDIAIGKAWGALGMGMPSGALRDRPASFLAALSTLAHGKVVPVPGGALIRGGDGAVIGATGISGDTSEKDEVCAVAGINAAGLISDPGAE